MQKERVHGNIHGDTSGHPPGSIAEHEARNAPKSVIQLPPPEQFPYPTSDLIYLSGSASIATGATSALGVSLTLDGSQCAVLNSLLIYGLSWTTAAVATFAVLVDNAPWPGLTRELPPQNASSALLGWGPDEIVAWIPQGRRISFLVTVAAGGPVTCGMQLGGWKYPNELRERYRALWGA